MEECEEAGTLEEVLEESGFQRVFRPQEGWISREPIVIEKVSVETRYMNIRKITPISFEKLVKVFELDGFRVKRQKGDHMSMVKP